MRTKVMLPSFIEQRLARKQPLLWINSAWKAIADVRPTAKFDIGDIEDAERHWSRFAGLLAALFPELSASGGIIESPLHRAEALQTQVMSESRGTGRWFIKADHALPVVGSI